VKRIFFPVILTILLIGIPLSGLSDDIVSVEDMASRKSEITSEISNAINSSASATITMTGVIDE
jgi:hypothetical protein